MRCKASGQSVWHVYFLFVFAFVFVFVSVFDSQLKTEIYLMFVCSGKLACILHLLLVRGPLPRVGSNSQFSNLVPGRKNVGVKASKRKVGIKTSKRKKRSFGAFSQSHSWQLPVEKRDIKMTMGRKWALGDQFRDWSYFDLQLHLLTVPSFKHFVFVFFLVYVVELLAILICNFTC